MDGIRVVVRLYAELNDFVPPERRQSAFETVCGPRTAVKDLLEGLGVPHPEVDLLLVNGEPSGFARHLAQGDRVAAFPAWRTLDLPDLAGVRPEAPRQVRFVLDGHLGRLAAFLRLGGFDCLYERNPADETLAAVSAHEQRVLLSRDVGLLKRGAVEHGYWVRETAPARQLAEVFARYRLAPLARPFSRCMRCNGRLAEVEKATVAALVPPRAYAAHADYLQCDACGRVYWKGSHYVRLEQLLRDADERSKR